MMVGSMERLMALFDFIILDLTVDENICEDFQSSTLSCLIVESWQLDFSFKALRPQNFNLREGLRKQ